jgi:hypothetical protein
VHGRVIGLGVLGDRVASLGLDFDFALLLDLGDSATGAAAGPLTGDC